MVVRVNLNTGAVTTLVNGASAGTCSPATYIGDGGQGALARVCVAAPAATANLRRYGAGTGGLALSASGAILYIADSGHHAVRALTLGSGIITAVAGTGGLAGYSGDGGLATLALLNTPLAVAVHPLTGALFIADTLNFVVRAVSTLGIITTVAGSAASA